MGKLIFKERKRKSPESRTQQERVEGDPPVNFPD
jgi:hypothetical protein